MCDTIFTGVHTFLSERLPSEHHDFFVLAGTVAAAFWVATMIAGQLVRDFLLRLNQTTIAALAQITDPNKRAALAAAGNMYVKRVIFWNREISAVFNTSINSALFSALFGLLDGLPLILLRAMAIYSIVLHIRDIRAIARSHVKLNSEENSLRDAIAENAWYPEFKGLIEQSLKWLPAAMNYFVLAAYIAIVVAPAQHIATVLIVLILVSLYFATSLILEAARVMSEATLFAGRL